MAENLAIRETDVLTERIQCAQCVDELLSIVAQLSGVKEVLKKQKVFKEYAIKYAQLEAAALIKIVELGGENSLKGYEKKVAIWLASLDATKRSEVIQKCEYGYTIRSVWEKEVLPAEKEHEFVDDVAYMTKRLVKDLKRNGIVNTADFRDYVQERIPDTVASKRETASALIDGCRNVLLKNGAVGVGNFSGLYVIPTKDKNEHVKEAIKTRLLSIKNDVRCASDLIANGGFCIEEFFSDGPQDDGAFIAVLLSSGAAIEKMHFRNRSTIDNLRRFLVYSLEHLEEVAIGSGYKFSHEDFCPVRKEH